MFSADTEGLSSTTEYVQLKNELEILNGMIVKVEEQVACDELADVERSIRLLTIPSSQSIGVSGARSTTSYQIVSQLPSNLMFVYPVFQES